MNIDEQKTRLLQEKELSMLKSLDELMRKNKIDYFLACGTALGCIRHSGFIPWDDDVDIYVLGNDYLKLKEIFSSQDTGILKLHEHSLTKNYPYSFPKIIASDTEVIENCLEGCGYKCGVYIDVFILQDAEDNGFLRFFSEKLRYFRYALLRAYYYEYTDPLRICIKRIVRKIADPLTIQEKLFKRYTKKDTHKKFYTDIGLFGKRSLFPKDIFKSRKYMQFEDVSLPVPEKCEKYLTMLYGDYMSLPPLDERISCHIFSSLIIDGKKII